MIVTLPHGYVDGLELFDKVHIDELRGAQQNYLADRELVVGNIGHVPKIIADMILSIENEHGIKWQGDKALLVQNLTSGDIETLLIKIREHTYGPKFYHEAHCPHCEKVNKNLRLDLDKLLTTKLSKEQLLKSQVFKLPKCSKEIELKPVYLKDLFDLIKTTTINQKSLITSMLLTSVKRLDTKSPVTEEDIGKLPATDISFITKYLEENKVDGTIDTDIEITCSSCNKDFKIKLNCFEPSFFDPTKGSTS